MKRWPQIDVLLVSIIATSCGMPQVNATPSRAAQPTPAQTILPSPVFTPKNTPTSRPLLPTVHPTLTFVPRPSPEASEAQFFERLQDNGGCELPCWWGFAPGQTSKQTIISQMHGATGAGGGMAHWEDLEISVVFTWDYSDNPEAIVRWLKVDYRVSHELNWHQWYQENPFYNKPMYPSLPYLLSTYGTPSQAFINFDVGIADMGLGIDLYFLFLDYTKAGWVAMLEMPLTRKDDMFVGCPMNASTTLWLWAPDDIETATEYGFANGTNLKTIEEATSMTLEAFYQQYANPANAECLASPMNLYTK
jgi:hypothetical protein